MRDLSGRGIGVQKVKACQIPAQVRHMTCVKQEDALYARAERFNCALGVQNGVAMVRL